MRLVAGLGWLTAILLCVGCGVPSSDFGGGKPADRKVATTDSGAVKTEQRAVSQLAGKVEIDGSSTVALITTLASDRFRKIYPNINVTVGTTGTGNGFQRFTKGETGVSDASRPIKADEFGACQKNNVAFVELPIAYDGLTFVVHPANDWATQLSVDDIRKIFREKDRALTWKDVNEAWPDEEIKLFAPGTGSGTFDYFKEVLGKELPIRPDMSTSENDNVLVQGVSGDKNAIGFFGAAYYFSNKEKLKAVAIVNPKTKEAVLPSSDSVISGTYAPYSRPLFIYVNRDSLKKPETKKFVEYYLVNAAKLAVDAGYFPLPDEVNAGATSNFKGGKLGTHFVTDEGNQREGSFLELFKPENLVTNK
jgi:phosphate transport system substrate-binding protein